ncbi:acyl-CoA dehydrogenase family protein [Salicibibacter cibarius]|uniref:Acyl-CoA dehydrogenase family protein n=1 Tax=Salicibibacter cibarius TaxID=2743000 RepID=A0A7T7CDI2_9BACI|nr:acyl-CoA dehydrogenase family protein [Salicibibacter cibarius]QQK78049.1 acyl-CoA dehydrogenase family protein [Salicibibacter cibarius]
MSNNVQTQKGIDYTKWEEGNDANWFDDDPILRRYANRYLSESMFNYVKSDFSKTGELASGPIDRRAVHTDRSGAPQLIRYNKKGEEINEIWYNEGYLQTVKDGYGTGVVSYRYDEAAPERVPFMVNAVLLYMLCEAETGFTCPVGLSQSAAFVLEKFGSKDQKDDYLSLLASTDPDIHEQGGTFLTEIQGGSDVGATETKAEKQDDHYLLSGEKWFASNCDAEIAITLARVNEQPSTRGLGLFLMPRTLPDGTKNNVTIRRLKDKLGVRAVASGELELNEAVGYLIGEEGKGFKYMAEALNVSRLGTALGGLGIARRAFLEAAIYTSHRRAFGENINRFPMVQETLINMITEIEAGWAITSQTIRKFDDVHTYGEESKENYSLMRILLSLAKYRCSDLGVSVAKEALELHGGNGYIEEYVTPRLLRDAVVNPVWEGTANIQALEVLKTLQKGGAEPFMEDLRCTLGAIEQPALEGTRVQLSKEVKHLEDLIVRLSKADERTQQAAAKKLTDFMYDLYAAVHLLEEAQYDLEYKGDDRRMLAAEQWVKMKFSQPADRGILSDNISEEVFKKLVCFQ